MNLIKRIRQFDAHVASTRIYALIDNICNILLVFSLFALVILAVAHQAQVLTALSN